MDLDLSIIIPALTALVSAVLVAFFNNLEKLNPGKKQLKEIQKTVNDMSESHKKAEDNLISINKKLEKLSSAQRTELQTQILDKCKHIQAAIQDGEKDYKEDLKQLIILYREYYLCGFNCQGKLYFNDTIKLASEDNNVIVHELMNTYFSEFNPNASENTENKEK